jgi:serine/threonine protein kinase
MEDLTGKQFGPYQIVAPLGEGGMAAVYKAYQPAMERYVALKVLPRHFAEDAQFVARFQREARLVAQLQHPHILPVFDYGQADNYTYIVMPFVQRGTLADSLKGQPHALPRIRQIISQIGDALNYAHAHGLIHRDVKPSNVLIDEGGNCLLTDFGLARMVETSVNLTTSGAIMGTPAYMSPEQGSGQKIDARSDIYSLGIILYEMATGRVPFKAETPIAVVFKHIQDPLPPAHLVNPELPEAIELVILKALSKNPEDRYQTAGDMVRAIQAAISDAPAISTPIAPAESLALPYTEVSTKAPPKQAKRMLPIWMWSAIGVVAVAIIGGLWIMFDQGVQRSMPSTEDTALSTAIIPPAETSTPFVQPISSSPIPPVTVLFQENFEDKKPLPFTFIENGNWKQETDETGNQVYEIDNLTGTGYPQIRFGSPAWKNYTIEYRTRMLDSTSASSDVFCTFRSQQRGWYIQTLHPPDTVFLLYYVPSPQSNEAIGSGPMSVVKGIWYSVRIEAQDTQLRVFLDNSLIIETTDSRVSQGDITLGVGPGLQAQFDDIKVIAPGK